MILTIIQEINAVITKYEDVYIGKETMSDDFRKIRTFFGTLEFYLLGKSPRIKNVPPEIVIQEMRVNYKFDPEWKWCVWKNATIEEREFIAQCETQFRELYARLHW
jgi:hypothetical protein